MKTKGSVENYYDAVANNYDNLFKDSISQAENLIVKDWIIQIIKESGKKMKICDLGCGTGLCLELITKDLDETEYEYTGIDISSEMINEAKRKFKNKRNASFIQCDIAEMKLLFENNSFDMVVSLFGSYSHVPKYKEGLRRISQVLKPGGKLFLMVYSKYSFRSIFDYVFRQRKKALGFERQYNIRNNKKNISCKALFYSPCIVRMVLEKTNFKRIKCRGLNFFFELGFLKTVLKQFNVGFVRRILEKESCLFGNRAQFAHSLIVFAEKNN